MLFIGPSLKFIFSHLRFIFLSSNYSIRQPQIILKHSNSRYRHKPLGEEWKQGKIEDKTSLSIDLSTVIRNA